MKLLINNRKLQDNTEKLKVKNKNYKFKKYDVRLGFVSSNGITLITLVLTIIILLILAGVVINLSIGENGLFNKAKKAREDYMLAANREQQELANLDIDKLAGEQTSTWKSEIVTAKDITNKTDKSNYYGAIVTNYTCKNNEAVNAWKIFYADENNIYLIADDYIHYDYCPPSASQTVSKYPDNSNYSWLMEKVISDYNGLSDITNPKIRALNKQYLEYLESNNMTIEKGDDPNIKVMAYMLDTDIWSVYAGEKAEFAIAGPTIELFLASYNQTHPDTYYRTKVMLVDESNNFVGYQVSEDGGYFKALMIDDVKYGNLYVISEKEKSEHMWIASPLSDSSDEWDGIMKIKNNGKIIDVYDSSGAGFRPLVCLKSDVQLETQRDGTFIIK